MPKTAALKALKCIGWQTRTVPAVARVTQMILPRQYSIRGHRFPRAFRAQSMRVALYSTDGRAYSLADGLFEQLRRSLRGSSMLIGLIVVVVGLVLYLMVAYNGLVRLKVQCDNAWSDIDVQLKRRYDLIPNIVETVKGYASHEKGTLEAVVAARNQAMSAQGPAAKGAAEGMLSGA